MEIEYCFFNIMQDMENVYPDTKVKQQIFNIELQDYTGKEIVFYLLMKYIESRENGKMILLKNKIKSTPKRKLSEKEFFQLIISCDIPVYLLLDTSEIIFSNWLRNNTVDFLVDLVSELVNQNSYECCRSLNQLLQNLSRHSPHSALCSRSSEDNSNATDIFKKNLFLRILDCIEESLLMPNNRIGKDIDPDCCSRCIGRNGDSAVCHSLLVTSLSWLPTLENHETDHDKMHSVWKVPQTDMDLLSIYQRNTVANEEIPMTFSEFKEDPDSQKILSILDKCVNGLRMEKHLSQHEVCGDDPEMLLKEQFHLSRAATVLNSLLSHTLASPSDSTSSGTSGVRKLCRQLVRVISQTVIAQLGHIMTNDCLHVDFLVSCVSKGKSVREIFCWYVKCDIFEMEIEERFLTRFSEHTTLLNNAFFAESLLHRIVRVNARNMPISKFLKLFKLLIQKMATDQKRQLVVDISKNEDNRSVCSYACLESSLRRCCNKLSADPDGNSEIIVELEYYMLLYPCAVISQLISLLLLGKLNKEVVFQAFKKLSYCLSISMDTAPESVLASCFSDTGSGVFPTEKIDIGQCETIKCGLRSVFQLIEDPVVLFSLWTSVVQPSLETSYPPINSLLILTTLLDQSLFCTTDICTSLFAYFISMHLSRPPIYNCPVSHILPQLIGQLLSVCNTLTLVNRLLSDLPFGFTKLLLYSCASREHPLTIPPLVHPFLSSDLLIRHNIRLIGAPATSLPVLTADDVDLTMCADVRVILQLCGSCEPLLKAVLDCINYDKDCWYSLTQDHIIAALCQIGEECNTDAWKRMMKFLLHCIEKGLVYWPYNPVCGLPIHDVDKECWDCLTLLRLLEHLVKTAAVSKNQPGLTRLVVSLLADPDLIAQTAMVERIVSSTSRIADYLVFCHEWLHPLLSLLQLPVVSGFCRQSLVLLAQPWIAALSSLVSNRTSAVPPALRPWLGELAKFEQFFL